MAAPFDLDDPAIISRFLDIVRGDPQHTSPAAAEEPARVSIPVSPSEPVAISNRRLEDKPSSALHNLAGSPENLIGTRAPPSTPASQPSLQQHNGSNLEPIAGAKDLVPIQEADDLPGSNAEDTTAALVILANKSTENLSHSMHAPVNRNRILKKSLAVTTPPTKPLPMERKTSATLIERTTNSDLLEKMKALGAGSSFQDNVVAQFRQESSDEDINKMVKVEGSGQDSEETNETAKEEATETAIEETTATAKLRDTGNKINNKMETQYPASKSTLVPTSGDEEDREHKTHFSSWGPVAPRDGPRSRVRTVVLTNLPAMTDATLVASLIHGGAIETLKVLKPSETTPPMARVTFTTGDAANAYHAKYPNGLDFKYHGKKYTVFVDLGTEVDVVSGIMRGYLESGASRIVRATGAEEDWGIMALNKIASGKGRKVEAVVDTYRGEVRSIIFRFTNIADAVQFKAQLVRDDDWESCNIQFMIDPCEGATGVHLESY